MITISIIYRYSWENSQFCSPKPFLIRFLCIFSNLKTWKGQLNCLLYDVNASRTLIDLNENFSKNEFFWKSNLMQWSIAENQTVITSSIPLKFCFYIVQIYWFWMFWKDFIFYMMFLVNVFIDYEMSSCYLSVYYITINACNNSPTFVPKLPFVFWNFISNRSNKILVPTEIRSMIYKELIQFF